MENKLKRYLDMAVNQLVKGTKIDYENKKIYYLFHSLLSPFPLHSSPHPLLRPSLTSFSTYCKNIYGLTQEEIDYVWNEYREIILNKIENGES